MKDRKYIISVSGGVDSMVLLDALANSRLSELINSQPLAPNSQLVIAHFDHGIREDSARDDVLVRGVAEKYGLQYESERAELGVGASEDTARKARYGFLRQCCNKYNAQLITAHHQDDVIETVIINLIRGTGWRGLAPMAQSAQISELRSQSLDTNPQLPSKNQKSIINNQTLRPLLNVSKQDILAYAKKYDVRWREDSTNTDTAYLRNYVRHVLLSAMEIRNRGIRKKFIELYNAQTTLKNEIAIELQKVVLTYHISNIRYNAPRHELIMFPPLVAKEVIYRMITQLDPGWHPISRQVLKTLHFIKTAKNGKSMDVTNRVRVNCTLRTVEFFVKST